MITIYRMNPPLYSFKMSFFMDFFPFFPVHSKGFFPCLVCPFLWVYAFLDVSTTTSAFLLSMCELLRINTFFSMSTTTDLSCSGQLRHFYHHFTRRFLNHTKTLRLVVSTLWGTLYSHRSIFSFNPSHNLICIKPLFQNPNTNIHCLSYRFFTHSHSFKNLCSFFCLFYPSFFFSFNSSFFFSFNSSFFFPFI